MTAARARRLAGLTRGSSRSGSVPGMAARGWLLGAAALVLAGCGSEGRPQAVAVAPTATPTATATPGPAAEPAPSVAVLWSLERPERAARRVRRLPAVESATVASRGVALLRSSAGAGGRVVERVRAGYAIPLDIIAVDPRGYAATLAPAEREPFLSLRHGQAVISETSARLRGIGAGGTLRLVDGSRLRVTAVVADDAIRSSEAAVSRGDPRLPRGDGSNVLAVLRDTVDVEALARRAERGSAARILGTDSFEGPARPAELKRRFGEPAVGLPYGDDWVRLDPGFLRRNIVARTVPVLGTVTCHRAMIGPLRAALGELRRRGLARLVDPGDYAGCYAPRRIRPGGSLSLHAWGLAVDLNAAANPFGGRSRQDPRLVRIMVSHGFTWGGDWPTVRDPMHFEWRGR
jgi:D-alanyl-D-alanine carboxypeptidase